LCGLFDEIRKNNPSLTKGHNPETIQDMTLSMLLVVLMFHFFLLGIAESSLGSN
jgi:hypothetical protein